MLPKSSSYQFCRETIPSCSGSKEKKVFRRSIDANGVRSLVFTGVKNTYREIQENLHGSTVSDIVARSLLGDNTDYTADPAAFVDLTTSPKNLMEAQNMLIRSRDLFNSLPVDVRKEYDNNFSSWLSSVNDGSFVKRYSKTSAEELENVDRAEFNRIKELANKFGGFNNGTE